MTDTISKEQQRIIGAQALAQGALAAGVQVVSGYPGSPATEVFDHLAQRALPHIAWAANEKVAAEIVAGASLGGSRALLIVKSVGLNVALDPLATLAMTGCRAGMVILVGDDPGASGSQNEQDSRWLARTAELPLVEPTSVAGAAALVAQAFAWSESAETPVIVRFNHQPGRRDGPCRGALAPASLGAPFSLQRVSLDQLPAPRTAPSQGPPPSPAPHGAHVRGLAL